MIDCVNAVTEYKKAYPDYEVQAGFFLVCLRDVETKKVGWHNLYYVHTWMLSPKGEVFDPTVRNIEQLVEKRSDVELMKDLAHYQMGEACFTTEVQLGMFKELIELSGKHDENTLGVDIIYFPGLPFPAPNYKVGEEYKAAVHHACAKTRINRSI